MLFLVLDSLKDLQDASYWAITITLAVVVSAILAAIYFWKWPCKSKLIFDMHMRKHTDLTTNNILAIRSAGVRIIAYQNKTDLQQIHGVVLKFLCRYRLI